MIQKIKAANKKMKNAIENRNRKLKLERMEKLKNEAEKKNICEKSFQLKPGEKNWNTNKDQRQKEGQE